MLREKIAGDSWGERDTISSMKANNTNDLRRPCFAPQILRQSGGARVQPTPLPRLDGPENQNLVSAFSDSPLGQGLNEWWQHHVKINGRTPLYKQFIEITPESDRDGSTLAEKQNIDLHRNNRAGGFIVREKSSGRALIYSNCWSQTNWSLSEFVFFLKDNPNYEQILAELADIDPRVKALTVAASRYLPQNREDQIALAKQADVNSEVAEKMYDQLQGLKKGLSNSGINRRIRAIAPNVIDFSRGHMPSKLSGNTRFSEFETAKVEQRVVNLGYHMVANWQDGDPNKAQISFAEQVDGGGQQIIICMSFARANTNAPFRVTNQWIDGERLLKEQGDKWVVSPNIISLITELRSHQGHFVYQELANILETACQYLDRQLKK